MNKKYNITNTTLDKIAIISSILCAFHCAILPIIIATSTWIGLQQLKNPVIEWFFILLGLVLFYLSIFRNMNKHKSKSIIFYGFLGAVFLIISRFKIVEEVEVYVTCIGTFFLVYAHIKNIRYTYKQK